MRFVQEPAPELAEGAGSIDDCSSAAYAAGAATGHDSQYGTSRIVARPCQQRKDAAPHSSVNATRDQSMGNPPLPRRLVGTARSFLAFGVAVDVDFVAVSQLDRWSLLACDGQLAEGAELRLLSLFPHERTPVFERWCPYTTVRALWGESKSHPALGRLARRKPGTGNLGGKPGTETWGRFLVCPTDSQGGVVPAVRCGN